MLYKCHWIVLYTVHIIAFCLGPFFRTRCTHILCASTADKQLLLFQVLYELEQADLADRT